MSDTIETLARPAHRDVTSDRTAKRVMWLYIGPGLILVGAMVIVGLGMRFAQGGCTPSNPVFSTR